MAEEAVREDVQGVAGGAGAAGTQAGGSDIEQLSFKEGLDELDGIVRALEGNQLELEESIKSYERGVALLASLQKRLDDAQQKVTVLMGELEPEGDEVDTRLS